MLASPWLWWETRVHIAGDHEYQIRCEPNADDISDYFVTFGPDRDFVVLTDPPSLFLIHLQEVHDFDDGLAGRTLLTASMLTARVVWWQQPGPGWWPVPQVRTCRPGLYQHDSQIRGRDTREHGRRGRDDWSDAFYEPMPNLDWPLHPMVIDGQQVGAPSLPLTGDRCRQCQRYMTESERGTDLFGWGGDLIATLQNAFCPDCRRMQAAVYTPNEIREREGLVQHPRVHGLARPSHEWVQSQRYGPSILPEQDVVDEIDRLVNEQVRPGPRDDYNADRYPKCVKCPHPWHGLCCEKCACLGELEDPI